ncbi:hypothetical protein ACFPRB_17250 [Metabacillus niabensis]|uniref:YobI-like P-loop NTPase domain-containing protein n=2 Tax=Metabacillus niabensis TaxID=324854 RepID=A0ABT9YWP5_9BACI|nr:hypothetical protein [Metabacillus niabensis]MDQ0224412.1 hypothetical protein [Metabacillus niabensis]
MDQLIEFESLAAKKKLEEDDEFYFCILKKALEKKENKNIAITGGYGAGKTTIIDAYFEKYKEKAKKMMRVSIATFKTEQDQTGNSPSSENILEQQILQQMFYQVNPNRISNSKFTKISDLSFWYIFSIIFYLLGTGIFLYLLITNKWLTQINGNLFGKGLWENVLLMLVYSILIGIYGIAIYMLLMVFRKLGVSKFGVANTNIEFTFHDGSTVFNHYLDEIIYLFKKSNYCYIVFEDLDRFQNVKIFERLRSLNTILNSSAQLRGLDIKFIYAMKDDIFSHEDESELVYNRTKFFDFIIPTIKIIHSSNAETILMKKLNGLLKKDNNYNADNNQKLSEKLIEDISLFINDMRTLINICNEFEVYRLRLIKSSITYNHLFAFVVYKNIYPKDYSDLLENKGIVYSVFNKKAKEEMISELQNEIRKIKNTSYNGLGDIITGKDEIAMLFAKKRKLVNNKLIKQGRDVLLRLTGSENRVVGEQVLRYLMDRGINGEFGVYLQNYNDDLEANYANVDDFVTINSINYLKLYRDFEQNMKNEVEVNSKIKILEKKIKSVQTKSISRLIKEDGIEPNIDFINNKLLYFLIRNNWLNESYEDYLTVFREGTLSQKENEFIQSIKLGYNIKNLHFPLEHVDKVSQKVRVDDINNMAVFNLKLIEYLLVNDTEENEEKISRIIHVLFCHINQNFEEYIELLEGLGNTISTTEESLVRKFLTKSMQNGIDIWGVINEDLSIVQLMNYVVIILENCKYDDLCQLESVNYLCNFISCEFDIERLSDSPNLYEVLERLGVKFNNLHGISSKAKRRVLQINCYQINLQNLETLLETNSISFKLIKSNENLYKYCMNNLKPLMDNVLLKQKDYNEKEEDFIEFIGYIINKIESMETKELGDDVVNVSDIESLINHWQGIVNNLTEVHYVKIVKIMYKLKKFMLSWQNIEHCKDILETNELNFNINHILSEKINWQELISNSTISTQEEFYDRKKYNNFVNLVIGIKSPYSLGFKGFVEKLKIPVSLEKISDVDSWVIDLLIERKLLSWDVNIYRKLSSKEYKEKYVIGNLDIAETDILELIHSDELEWSFELTDNLVKRDILDLSLLQKYIKNRVLKIELQEFTALISKNLIYYDEELLEILLEQTSLSNLLIEYLIYLSLSYKDKVIDLINNYELQWDQRLFNKLRGFDSNSASIYLLDNPIRIESIKMDQELFDSLIVNSSNIELNLEIITDNFKQLNITPAISQKIYENLVEDSKLVLDKLEKNVIVKLVQLLPVGKSAEFLYEFFKYGQYDRDDIFAILLELQRPFNEIRKNGKSFKIEDNHASIQDLLNYLESDPLQVIYRFDVSEGGYVVRNKRK